MLSLMRATMKVTWVDGTEVVFPDLRFVANNAFELQKYGATAMKERPVQQIELVVIDEYTKSMVRHHL